ncbi:MAG: adenylate/guanylate cyclase domain-containing protein [Candidatus Neomarinimicrobiota bacterium]
MRKLAAIMFTDIVGFTALMGEDEPKALQLLQHNRELLKPIIRQFHGEWLKEMGDGTLSCFASAVDAVNCALAIQHVLTDDPDLKLRIGIHIGDVVFEKGDVFGDGVNVASRIEPLAEPGGICISGRVYDDIQNKPDIETIFLGEKELKHVKRPIKVYALTGEGLPAPTAGPVTVELDQPAAIARGRRYARYGGPVLAAVLAFLAYGLFFGQRLEGDEPIPIAVVDFVNETSEPELDGLSGMLITSLEQSQRLAVLTRSRMFDILKQLGKNDVDHIDETLGKEVARQAHLDVLIIASIRKLGRLYIIDLKALVPDRDEYLFTAREEGEGQESILTMLDRLAEKTRVGLKEKMTEIRATSLRVAEVTTPNLEAYQHYFAGEQLINNLQFEAAQAEFEKAIAIDSTFGLAYYRLAYAHSWQRDVLVERTLLQKTVKLMDRIPEKERYLVRAMKAAIEEGYAAGVATLKDMEQIYPDDKEMLYNIGDWSWHIGDFATAAEYLEKTLAMDPIHERALQHLTWTFRDLEQYEKMFTVAQRYVDEAGSGDSYIQLSEAYATLGDFEAGLQTLQRARESDPDNPYIIAIIADLYTYQGQFDRAEAELESFVEGHQPLAAKRIGYSRLANIYPYTGKYQQAIQTCDKLLEIAWQAEDTARAALLAISKGSLLMWGWHDPEQAWEEVQSTLQFSNKLVFTSPYWAGLARAAVWQQDYALADSIARFRTLDWWYPYIQVKIHANRQLCDAAASFADTAYQSAPGFIKISDLYWLAECRFKEGRLDQAEESLLELQTVNDNRYRARAILYPKSFYLLGKIYEQKGDVKAALEHFEKFLDLWKNADEDLPDLIDAKMRYERLKTSLGS